MIDGRLMIDTDYGTIPLSRVTVGMYVQTIEGERIVTNVYKSKYGLYRHYIRIEGEIVRFTKDQHFFVNGRSVQGMYLRAGDKVDSEFGQSIVQKSGYLLSKWDFYTIVTDSILGNYRLSNGIYACI